VSDYRPVGWSGSARTRPTRRWRGGRDEGVQTLAEDVLGVVDAHLLREDPARARETVHYEAICRWHPLFVGNDCRVWSEGSVYDPATTQSGDVHVIGNGAVLIGMSERTTRKGGAARQAPLRRRAARRIVALSMPRSRAFMHLDTVMTMFDGEIFTKYAGLGMLLSYVIEPGDDLGELCITERPVEDMHAVIAVFLGLDSIRVLTPTQDIASAERERWDDGVQRTHPQPWRRRSLTNATSRPTPSCTKHGIEARSRPDRGRLDVNWPDGSALVVPDLPQPPHSVMTDIARRPDPIG
jgi:arginine deiminase